jgi:hypothetical protein
MYDLKLTESGDIDIEIEQPISTYKVSFSVVEHARQRVRFIIMPPSVGTKKSALQKISFKFGDILQNYKAQDKSLDDIHEATQAIRIALRTEKGDTHNQDMGSHAYQIHHKLYTNKKDLEDIQDYIQEVVDAILPGASVTVTYTEDAAAGYFKYQAVKVHIDYDGKQVDEFVF